MLLMYNVMRPQSSLNSRPISSFSMLHVEKWEGLQVDAT